MSSSLKLGLLLGVSSLVLTACGGGGGSNNASNPTPVVVATTTQSQFGLGFEQIFNTDVNGSAADPVPAAAVLPISLTDDPIPVP